MEQIFLRTCGFDGIAPFCPAAISHRAINWPRSESDRNTHLGLICIATWILIHGGAPLSFR